MLRALVLVVALAVAAGPALAANADRPYSNVDKSNDKGNDTGNSRVDMLNRAQTDDSQGVKNPALGSSSQSTVAPHQ